MLQVLLQALLTWPPFVSPLAASYLLTIIDSCILIIMGKRTCTGCGRLIKGHMGPYGRGKCTLNPLNPDNSGAQGGRSSRGNSDVGSPDQGIGCYPPRRQQDPAPMFDARPSAAPPTRDPEPPQIPGHPGPPRLAQLWSTVDSRPSLPIWGPPPQTSRWPAHCSPTDHRREQS